MIEIKHGCENCRTRRRRHVTALRDINLTFGQTAFASGSGKPTLFNTLSGLDRATEGQVPVVAVYSVLLEMLLLKRANAIELICANG